MNTRHHTATGLGLGMLGSVVLGCFHGAFLCGSDDDCGPTASCVDGACIPSDGTTSAPSTDSTDSTSAAPSDESIDSSTSGGSSEDSSGPVPNEDPLAINDGPLSMLAHETLDITPLRNDWDPEGGDLQIVDHATFTTCGFQLVPPAGGTTFGYAPIPEHVYGTDRFWYEIEDEGGGRASAEVRIVVRPSYARVVLEPDGIGKKGLQIDGAVAGEQVGTSVASAGDVDGDGFADLLLGTGTGGNAYLVYGEPGQFSARPPGSGYDLTTLEGVTEFTSPSGGPLMVSGAGDVNGDGYADILAGDPAANMVYLRLGAPDRPEPSLDLATAADATYSLAGGLTLASVSGAGDTDGDGRDDLLVGANGPGDTPSEAYLVLGRDSLVDIDLVNADVTLLGEASTTAITVSGAGDVNGDGYSELIVGNASAALSAGRVYLVFGGPWPALPTTLDLTVEADVIFEGAVEGDEAGRSVSGAGDTDGDGYADVIIGTPRADRPDPTSNEDIATAGAAYLVFGGPSMHPTVPLGVPDPSIVTLWGSNESDEAGTSVRGAGDVNGDGFADLLLGAPSVSAKGTTYLVLGRQRPRWIPTVDLELNADVKFIGSSTGDRSGQSTSGAGDFDGDGYADLLLSSPEADVGGLSDSGVIYVLQGDDLDGKTDILGTDADDALAGSPAPEFIIGGLGNDTLRSEGGADVLIGGGGDDVLTITDDGFVRLDGGPGEDTLELGGSFSLDLTAILDPRLAGIEHIVLDTSGPSILVLSPQDAANLSNTSNTVTIHGDGDDEVELVGQGWTSRPADGQDIYSFEGSAVEIKIDTDVDVEHR